jgi:Fe-S oxidoreductase
MSAGSARESSPQDVPHDAPQDGTAATEGCRYCWMCRHVCPVGHVTHLETLTPHGWALMIASVARGVMQWDEESTDALYKCADCGMCRTHCVTDQPLPDAIARARAAVAAAGLAPPPAYRLRDTLEKWGNQYADPGSVRSPGRDTPAERRTGPVPANTVGLFVGDAATHLDPQGVDAARALLSASGIDAVSVGLGRSNGIVASSLGFPETAAVLARNVLADVEAAGCRELLVLGPGDRYAFERLYGERLGITWPEVTVREVTDVLAEALVNGKLAFRRTSDAPLYAYHDPCHAPRIGRDGVAPRALLGAALGEASARRLFWREGRAHPCGAVGGLELTQPALADALADARFADAAAAGAEWLVTEDASCLHHLRSRGTGRIAVHGLYDLLAARLDEHSRS